MNGMTVKNNTCDVSPSLRGERAVVLPAECRRRAVAARSAGVRRLGGRGASAVFGRWPAQLSCCLQKANVVALRGACGDARSWGDAGAAGVDGGEEIGVLAAVDEGQAAG